MAVQEKSPQERGSALGSTILDGAVIVFVSPLVVPALLLGMRPVAKTVIKGGLFLTGTVKQLATTTSAGWSDFVAEALGQARATTAPGEAGGVAMQPQQTEEADLQRLTGIGRKYAELLREAGVESVHTLARRNPNNLHEKLMQVNEQQQIVSQTPSLELVTDWITQAQREAM